jgi:unsaturated rhamnogalacturonyl hydrolase
VRDTIVRDSMDRPIVTGISGPTTVGGFQTYANVPVRQDLAHGVGAAILILIETSGLPQQPAAAPGRWQIYWP